MSFTPAKYDPAGFGNLTQEPVGFDIDGVAADFITHYQNLTIKHSGVDLFLPGDIDDPPCWHWPQFRGYSEELMDWKKGPVWMEIKSDPTFWRSLGAHAGASQLSARISQLVKQRDIYFVTNRAGINVKQQTEDWVREYIGLSSPTVLISSHKGMCAKALGLSAYIDDYLPNALDVAEKSPATRVYLLNRRYNRDESGVKPEQLGQLAKLIRVDSVAEMLEREDNNG